MFMRFVWAGLLVLGVGLTGNAADLTAIQRTIAKEPAAYKGKPRYALLVFGKEAKTRVWLVRDDDSLYIDLNGNGDLTEPGERVFLQGNGFNVNKIVERDGTVHHNLRIELHSDGTFEMTIGRGERQQYVGIGLMDRPSWADKAENAPIIHFNGPVSFDRYGPTVSIPRTKTNNRRLSLRLMLGTPGVGKGTFASYDEICSENLGPITADIVYSHKDRVGEMFEQRIELLHDG
jgi:hypothetical protein